MGNKLLPNTSASSLSPLRTKGSRTKILLPNLSSQHHLSGEESAQPFTPKDSWPVLRKSMGSADCTFRCMGTLTESDGTVFLMNGQMPSLGSLKTGICWDLYPQCWSQQPTTTHGGASATTCSPHSVLSITCKTVEQDWNYLVFWIEEEQTRVMCEKSETSAPV